MSIGSVLRLGKSAGNEKNLSPSFRGFASPPGGRISQPSALYAAITFPRGLGFAQSRRADAGNLQFGLFRARFPSATNGRRPGGRERPGNSQRTSNDAHHKRL